MHCGGHQTELSGRCSTACSWGWKCDKLYQVAQRVLSLYWILARELLFSNATQSLFVGLKFKGITWSDEEETTKGVLFHFAPNV